MTDSVFSQSNKLFQAGCMVAGLPSTVRQASKWRNGKGHAVAMSIKRGSEFMLALVRLQNQEVIDSFRSIND